MVRATATSITAAAVAIAEGHAAIAGIIISLPQHLVVAQLIGSIFILEAESAVPADLSAFEAQPDSGAGRPAAAAADRCQYARYGS